MQALKAAPSKLHAKVEPVSVAVKLKFAEVLVVSKTGPAVMAVSGGVLSIVTVTPPERAELLDVSTARAVIAFAPSETEVEFQLMLYGAVVSVPTTTPLTRKSTWSTATLSVALADNVTLPPNVAPFTGPVSVTLGGVVSGGVVTDAGALEREMFPAPSSAHTLY